MGCTSSKNGELEDAGSLPESPYTENRRSSVNQAQVDDDGEEETSAEEELIALKMIADAEHEAMEELEDDNEDDGSEGDSSTDGDIAAPSIGVSDDEDALSIPTMIVEESEVGAIANLEASRLQEATASAKAEQAAAVAAKHAAEAEKARVEAELAEMKAETEALKAEAENAKAEAELAKAEASAEKARAEAETLQAQAEMSAALEATAQAEVLTAEAQAAKAKAEAEKADAEAGADAAKADLETLHATKDEAESEVARVKEEAENAHAEAQKAAAARDAAEAERSAAEEAAATAKAEAEATEAAANTAKGEAEATEEAAATAKGEAEAAEKTASEAAAAAKEEAEAEDKTDAVKATDAAPALALTPKEKSLKSDDPKSRQEGNDQANGRMFKELQSMKRREKSLVNRKKANAFAMGVARDKKMSFGGTGVTLGIDKPLVVRKSIRSQKKGSRSGSSSLKGVSEEPSTGAKLLGAELNLVTPTPAAGRELFAPAASGPISSKKSVRKSIRQMFKSTRRPKSRGGPVSAADSSPKKAVGAPKRKPGAVTVAEIDAGLPEGDEYETLDVRAVDAARWTDKVVVQLIDEITKRGEKNSAGQYCITFGKLFDETANIFDALVGIIKTAKKYHVVHANKDQLWQGQDDDEIVTLLKGTHGGVLINRRHRTKVGGGTPAKSKGFAGNSLANQNQKCHVCTKTVYPMEFVGASDKAFHKACFRCKACNCILKSNDFCNVKDEFYCPTHYKELINLAGGAGNEAL